MGRRPKASTRRGLLGIATLAIAMAIMSIVASASQAATVYRATGGTFAEPGSGQGEMARPGPIAVDPVTGDVLASSSYPLTGINVYAPEGNSAHFLESVPLPEGGSPAGLAIDDAGRILYVSKPALGVIEKLIISGAGPLTLTRDPNFVSPTQGSGPGEIGSFGSSSLAVDPSTGDLLVADVGNERVSRFSPTGTFISGFDGADSTEGTFHQLSSIAVSSAGDVYVVDIVRGDISFPESYSVLERFHADGSADNSFAVPVETPRAVTTDPNSGNVVVMGRSDGFFTSPQFPIRLYTIHGGAMVDEQDLAESESGAVTVGLAIQSGGLKRLYVSTVPGPFDNGAANVKAFDSRLAADVTLSTPTNVASRSADVSGTVDTLGEPTTYHFEYSREGGAPLETEALPVTESDVEAQLEGLVANSEYVVRLVATNPNASIRSAPRTFRTRPSAPEVITGNATSSAATIATLSGSVNPFGEQTTYYFEYGTTTAYGSRVPANHDAAVGAGRDALRVSQEIVGLQAAATYHYRLVAKNGAGTSVGEDRVFSTRPAETAPRVFELVTPAGTGVNTYPDWMHASPDGDAVTYVTRSVVPGNGYSSPGRPRYTATRTATGWNSVGLDPLLAPPIIFTGGLFTFDALAVSEDGTKAVVMSTAALAPGGVKGATNLYLFDIATQTYVTIGSTPGTETFAYWAAFGGISGSTVVVGGTANFSKLFFQTEGLPVPFIQGVTGAATYEWSASRGLRLVGPSPFGSAATTYNREPRAVSEDGSVVYYRGEELGLVVEVDGAETFEVSGRSQGVAPDYYGASTNGAIAYYVEEAKLYRFDLATRTSTLLAARIPQGEPIGVSADGSYVYFVREIGEVGQGVTVLSVWHEGAIHQVAAIDPASILIKRISENGRYLAFGSRRSLTGYRNEGVEEIFRYDALTEELTCASCRTDGGKPRGPAEVGEVGSLFEFYVPRFVSNQGEVFFDTPDPLVPADVNSSRDVYSFDGTHQTLISSGTGTTETLFGDATPDGSNVFFTTGSRLVKADRNDDFDVYDARRGGGIPGQEAEDETPGCTGAACRVAVAVAPSPPSMVSEGVTGARPASKARSCPKGKRPVGKGGERRCVKPKKKGQGKKAKHPKKIKHGRSGR